MGEGKKPKSKSKHKNIQIFKKYKIESGKVVRPLYCKRCGPGTLLAKHKDRLTCGRCGFSEKNKA